MRGIYIGGPGGIGKTTVGLLVAEAFTGFRFVEGSTIFRLANGITSPGDIDTSSAARARNDSVLAGMLDSDPRVVLTGHFFLSSDLLKYFDMICLLILPIDALVERRASDPQRTRDIDTNLVSSECDATYARFCEVARAISAHCVAVPAVDNPKEIARRIAFAATRMRGYLDGG